ncbi:replication initiator protein [Dipodfec virus UOA04_Rod_499]|nr:replication initiator protein [Dipodfec virus UOA04_Rod_499]
MVSREKLSDFVSKYLDNECLHPVRIRNKYTGQYMYTSCGHCMVCLLKKANTQTSLASSMSSHFKYTYFVTLKYSEEYIPKLRVKSSDWSDSDNVFLTLESERILPPSEKRTPSTLSMSLCYTHKQYVDHFRKVSGRYSFQAKQVIYPSSEFDFQDYIPYIDREDFFFFMKRLRILIDRKFPNLGYGKKILYYAVSEYGPRTLRPHWHLLLFTDSSEVSEALSLLVRSAWSYGSYDISLSRGFAASYVASYVNSFACLPNFYTDYPELRPRSYHSKGYSSHKAFSLPTGVSDLEKLENECFNGIPVQADGQYVTVKPSRSFKDLLFPRFSEDLFAARHDVCQFVKSLLRAPSWLVRNGRLSIDFPDFFDFNFNIKDFSYALSSYIFDIYSDPDFFCFRDRCSSDIGCLFRSVHRLFSLDSFAVRDVFKEDYVPRMAEMFRRLFSRVRRWLLAWRLSDPLDPLFSINLYKLVDSSFHLRDRERYRCLVDYFSYLEGVSLDDSLTGLEKTTVYEYLKAYTINSMSNHPDIVSSFQSTLRNKAFVKFYDRIKHKEYNDLTGSLFV